MAKPKPIITSTSELATYLGLSKQGLYKREELPAPDFHSVSGRECWLPETADAWDAAYRKNTPWAASLPSPKQRNPGSEITQLTRNRGATTIINTMTPKIYGALFNILALAVAIILYPKHPLICGVAIGLFALALLLQGAAVILRRCQGQGQGER